MEGHPWCFTSLEASEIGLLPTPAKKKKICSQDARSLLAAENTKRWELVVVEGTKF